MKQIYAFAEGNMEMRALLGGKGANLAEMTNLGLPVPQGFTLTTAACHDYQQHHGLSEALLTELDQHVQALEKATGMIRLRHYWCRFVPVHRFQCQA